MEEMICRRAKRRQLPKRSSINVLGIALYLHIIVTAVYYAIDLTQHTSSTLFTEKEHISPTYHSYTDQFLQAT